MKSVNLLIAGLFLTAAALPVQAENIAIINGSIYPMTGDGSQTIANGTLLIKDNAIEAVGAGLAVPAGYRTIDAKGKPVTPGFFNAMTTLGIAEVTLSAGLVDARAKTSRFAIAPDVSKAYNADNSFIPGTRIAGVTRSAIAMDATRSIFGGQGAITHFAPGTSEVSHPRAFISADMGELGGRRAGGSRTAAWAELSSALRETDNLVTHPRNHWTGGKEKPLYDRVDLDALLPAAQGAVPFVIHVNRAADIRKVIALKKERPALRPIIYGGVEAWRLASELKAANIGVILDPFDNLPENFSHIDSTLENAARLHAAGVKIAMFSTGDGSERLLSQSAGNAVANGLPYGGALLAVTRNPAELFGISDQVGTLTPGKEADIVIWGGDPLEVMVAPAHVIIQGEEIKLVSRQTRLRDRYRTLAE